MSEIISVIKDGLEGIDNKFTSKMRAYESQLSDLNNAFTSLAQKGVHNLAGFQSVGPAKLGDLVLKEFQANRDLFEKTRSVRLEIKAAGDAVTTASGRTILGVGVGAVAGGVLGIQNGLLTRTAGGVTAAEYSRYTGQQGAAAVQAAEGDEKAPVRPDHDLINQSAITIAGLTKVSRQAMDDSQALMAAVETTLARSVATALDDALVKGVIAPAFDGFEALATAHVSAIYSALPDAISEAVSDMQINGFSPDLVAMHPSDWLAVAVAQGDDGHYLSGSYLGPLPTELRGLRVVLSPSITLGSALLMDSTHSELLTVDGFAVEMAYSGDDFSKNLITMRGETRVIPVFRTVGSATLVTPLTP